MLRRTFLGSALLSLFGFCSVKAATKPTKRPHRDSLVVTRNGKLAYTSSVLNTWFNYRMHVHANTVAVIALVDSMTRPELTCLRCTDILRALRPEEGVRVDLHVGKHCYTNVVRGDEPPTLRASDKSKLTTLEIPVSRLPGYVARSWFN